MRSRSLFGIALLLSQLLAYSLAAPASADQIPESARLQPAELAKTLQSNANKPVVLFVGPKFMYAQAHIKGAEFIGPASDPQSLDNLRKRVASLPKNAAVVVYCGCCPWNHCPNILPAYSELKTLGFTQAKALYMPNSFGTDWAEKGYPVEKGQ